MQPSASIWGTILSPLVAAGYEAVLLFFILSGFVLALPATNGKPQPYATFVTRRVFRIYVPYLAALLVAVAGAHWLHGLVTPSDWFHRTWSNPVSLNLVLKHVLFLGTYDTFQFNPPIWSLIYEMRISFYFPIVCAVVLRLKKFPLLLLTIALMFAPSLLLRLTPVFAEWQIGETLHYTAFFILGIYLAKERQHVAVWLRGLRRRSRAMLLLASLSLYIFGLPLLRELPFLHFSARYEYFDQSLTALGACGLIVLSMNSATCKRILHWPPIHRLGQMSYSLYLTHFIVMLYCVHLLYGRIPLPAIMLLTLVMSLMVSWMSYRFIEVPSMNLGRRLSNEALRRKAPMGV